MAQKYIHFLNLKHNDYMFYNIFFASRSSILSPKTLKGNYAIVCRQKPQKLLKTIADNWVHLKKSLNFYCLRTFSSVRTFSSGLSKHNTLIMHVPPSNGVASSDEITRCITGSAAAPPRYAQVSGRYCRLLSGHPPGETSRVFKHMFLQVTRIFPDNRGSIPLSEIRYPW